jgi:tetratricopeptide (TPR) repeat protein
VSDGGIQAADVGLLLLSSLIGVSSTFFVYRKASFPRNPADFWSVKTIEAALRREQSLLGANSEDMQGLVELGMACYQKGPESYVEGLKALERARSLGALDERVFWYAARMYEEKGLTHFALEDYERYLRTHPSDIPTQLRTASLFYKDGDTARALRHYQVVLAVWPGNATALYDVACIYNQQGEYSKARPLLEQCLSVLGDLPLRGHFMLGQAYEAQGSSQQALTEYEKAFTRSKSDINLLKALAGVYEKLGQAAQAQHTWNLAYQLNPRDPLLRLKVKKAIVKKIRKQAR